MCEHVFLFIDTAAQIWIFLTTEKMLIATPESTGSGYIVGHIYNNKIPQIELRIII